MKRNNLITELAIKIYCQNKALDIDEIKKEITEIDVEFIEIDGILPVPSSKKREIQPVYQIR
ncbi:MAG: hypothetical protein ACRDDH_04875 [Cetobacterium sp.]|uniref:hypothetical protein n=1 Tax=Cetobacterium sp. TaxID=2071632 RepID=UPI003EE5D9FE